MSLTLILHIFFTVYGFLKIKFGNIFCDFFCARVLESDSFFCSLFRRVKVHYIPKGRSYRSSYRGARGEHITFAEHDSSSTMNESEVKDFEQSYV